MRPALSGLLDGLFSRGGLLMPTQAWTLTLISPATRRQKNPFPPTALESLPPRLRSAHLLRLLLLIPRLTPEPPCSILLFFFIYILGSEPRIYVMPFWALKLNEYLIFSLLAFFLIIASLMLLLPELTWIMALSERSSSSELSC